MLLLLFHFILKIIIVKNTIQLKLVPYRSLIGVFTER